MSIISHCNDWYGNRPFSSGMQCYLDTHFFKKNFIADFLILLHWNTGFQFFPLIFYMLPKCRVFMTRFQISITTYKMRTALFEINFVVEHLRVWPPFLLASQYHHTSFKKRHATYTCFRLS